MNTRPQLQAAPRRAPFAALSPDLAREQLRLDEASRAATGRALLTDTQRRELAHLAEQGPVSDPIVLYFDGAHAVREMAGRMWSRSAYGWLAVRGALRVEAGQGALPENNTNNSAEYAGLSAGLERLIALGLTGPLVVRGDSELVIDQLLGIKALAAPQLIPLAQRVQNLAAQFAAVTFEWLPRERNATAHALAQAALPSWPEPAPEALPAAPDPATSTEDFKLPEFLKIYPGLAAAALQRDCTQGYALWSLARALDTPGAGRVSAETLRAAARTLGLSGSRNRKFQRALAQAQAAGLLEIVTHRRGGLTTEMVALRSAEMVALALGAETLGAWPVLVPAGKIARVGEWRAELWAAYLGGRSRTSRPIAQDTLRALTGVPERTQREYNRASDAVTVTYNLAVTDLDGSDPEVVMDAMNKHPGVFTLRDQATGKQRVAWPLPMNYHVDRQHARRGRLKKTNALLKHGLVNDAAGQRAKDTKVFFMGDKAQQRAVKTALREYEQLAVESKQAGESMPDPTQLRDRYYQRGRTRSRRGRWGQA